MTRRLTPEEVAAPARACVHCKETKAVELFSMASNRRRGRTCKSCTNAYTKAGREADPTTHNAKQQVIKERWRRARGIQEREMVPGRTAEEYHRARRYGLTRESFDQMVIDQGNRCAICRESFEGSTPYVDHDHACCPDLRSAKGCGKCVRALLCQHCNRGLGSFRDDPFNARRAAEYLEGFQR